MGLTGFIAILVLALFAAAVFAVVSGVRRKDTKLIFFAILGFVLLVGGIYWALVSFITSM